MTQRPKSRKKTAVALHYNTQNDKAPKVTAKGQGLVADKIISLARENQVPIKQDPDLVEVLAQVDINQDIPPSVYHVVAEMLAFVYKLNQAYPEKVK